jgi:hypothetical protein
LFDPIIITIPKPSLPRPKPAPAVETEKQAPSEPVAVDGRPRLVDGKPVRLDEENACAVVTSQENLSMINNGGAVSILVGREGEGGLKDLRAVSSSPEDVTVERELDIAGVQGRALFIVRSASERAGRYVVTFLLPCGKKDVGVSVR